MIPLHLRGKRRKGYLIAEEKKSERCAVLFNN